MSDANRLFLLENDSPVPIGRGRGPGQAKGLRKVESAGAVSAHDAFVDFAKTSRRVDGDS